MAVQRGQRAQPGFWRLKIQGRLRTVHRLGLDSSAVTEGSPGLWSQGCCCLSETEEFWNGPLRHSVSQKHIPASLRLYIKEAKSGKNTYARACAHTTTCMRAHTHTRTHTRTHVRTHIRARVFTHYVHARTHTRTLAHTHTHTHAHTRTNTHTHAR